MHQTPVGHHHPPLDLVTGQTIRSGSLDFLPAIVVRHSILGPEFYRHYQRYAPQAARSVSNAFVLLVTMFAASALVLLTTPVLAGLLIR